MQWKTFGKTIGFTREHENEVDGFVSFSHVSFSWNQSRLIFSSFISFRNLVVLQQWLPFSDLFDIPLSKYQPNYNQTISTIFRGKVALNSDIAE